MIEHSASDLIVPFVGQTAPKIEAQLERALDKFLFIDKANRLNDGQYASETADEMIALLGSLSFIKKYYSITSSSEIILDRLFLSYP